MKPDGYPLPWNELLDVPYWQINMWFCMSRDGWSEWQAKKPMSEIIPVIDGVLNDEFCKDR